MTVPSLDFLLFVAITAAIYNVSSAAWWHNAVFLVANISFLLGFAQDPLVFLPYAFFLCAGYVALLALQNGWSRGFPVILVGMILLFGWLKQYVIIGQDSLLPHAYVTVGLSYVFFRVLHLIIDAWQGALEVRVNPVTYFNFALNFTCLTSGPIQRFEDYYRMTFKERLPLDSDAVVLAIERIVLGFFKVVVLSASVGWLQKQQIAALSTEPYFSSRLFTGALIVTLYPIFLYLNFSGYTDVVIGSARMFRLQLPENFNRPFSSENFITFWSRWHITLSNWLKTYVYNPLLLSLMRWNPSPAVAPFWGVLAFFVTFFLIGLWHGQTSEFVFFGFLQGGGVAANKLYQLLMAKLLGRKEYQGLCQNYAYRALTRGLTFSWFAVSLLWFWSTWSDLAKYADILGLRGITVILVGIVVGSTLLLDLKEFLYARLHPIISGRIVAPEHLRVVSLTLMVLIIATVTLVIKPPAPEIIYKAF